MYSLGQTQVGGLVNYDMLAQSVSGHVMHEHFAQQCTTAIVCSVDQEQDKFDHCFTAQHNAAQTGKVYLC